MDLRDLRDGRGGKVIFDLNYRSANSFTAASCRQEENAVVGYTV